MIVKELEKQFSNVLQEKNARKKESPEERQERIMNKLGIQKHGKGKRKKSKKKKGGKKK